MSWKHMNYGKLILGIIVFILIFKEMIFSVVLMMIFISLYRPENPNILNKYAFFPYRVKTKKEVYRLFTSGFVHDDMVSLLLTLFCIYTFGGSLEYTCRYYYGNIGLVLFLSIFVGGILVSNLVEYVRYKSSRTYYSIGPQGGLNAILASCLLYDPISPICLFSIVCIPCCVFCILYVLACMFMNQSKVRLLSKSHVFGAVYGLVLNIIIQPKLFRYFIYQIKQLLG